MKQRLRGLYSGRYFFLCLIVAVTLGLHLYVIARSPNLVFDETHYVPEARAIITSHRMTEPIQPPLGKLFIVAGTSALGNNPWGWRVFSVAAGTVGLVLFFFICRRLGMSPAAANLATFTLAFENLTFVQAGLAMLDVYCYVFMLAAFLLYLSRRYVASGVAAGLSVLAKLTGAFALPVIALHWLLDRGRSRRAWLVLALAVVSFIVLLPLCDFLITRQFVNPFDRVAQMLRLTRGLTFATVQNPLTSRPWEWVLSYRPIAYVYLPHYYGGVSPTVWALILPSGFYLAWRSWRGNGAARFGLSWFIGTWVLWLPLSAVTDRISFTYYLYPAVGAVCLGIGLALGDALAWCRKKGPSFLSGSVAGAVAVFLLAHLALFLLLSPVTNIVSWRSLPWGNSGHSPSRFRPEQGDAPLEADLARREPGLQAGGQDIDIVIEVGHDAPLVYPLQGVISQEVLSHAFRQDGTPEDRPARLQYLFGVVEHDRFGRHIAGEAVKEVHYPDRCVAVREVERFERVPEVGFRVIA